MSYYFDGIDDHLYVAAPVNTVPFTMMVWAKDDDPTTTDERNCMGTSDTAGTVNFALMGKFFKWIRGSVRMGSSPSWTANTFTEIMDTGWHFWGFKVTSDTLQEMYFDDYLKGTQSSDTGTFAGNYDVMSVGCLRRATPAVFWKGWCAHAAMWNVGLTDEEMIALARGMNPQKMRASNLVFYDSLLTTTSMTVVGSPILDTTNNPPVIPSTSPYTGIKQYANSAVQAAFFTEIPMDQSMRMCANGTMQVNQIQEIGGATKGVLHANGTYTCPLFIEG